ncbi:MAG: D-alanyl-D-alanine carboxypeptidase [Clostridia bacterium]|nr:D-alanyl-D-alanine carboxypeptidase [Clostridia bacterium]
MAKKTEKKIDLIPLFIILLAVSFVLFLHWYNNRVPWYGEALHASTEETAELSSHSALMIDLTDAHVCYAKNQNERLPIASLTKIMTALTVIEKCGSLDAEYTFTEDIISRMEESHASVAGFEAGETVSVRDLLYGIMLPSGGDAALGAAEHIAGDEETFVTLMNRRAKSLGMKNTHFSDVTGLDDTDNYSTAADMALLFSKALENETFFEIVTADRYLTSATEQHKNGILLESTLNEPVKEYALEGKILGGKTGYTTGAGLCLASYAEVEGHRYILVTLGAGDGSKYPSYHFEDAAILYDEYYLT